MREVKVKEKKIRYSLKKYKRSKRIRITINCEAGVLVTAPKFTPLRIIDGFIKEKADLIFKAIEKQKKREKLPVFDYIENKEAARAFITERIKELNEYYKYKINRVFIKRQKRVWGSCSINRNLNFNFKILFLPKDLADYVVVHEICHLKEMNHSKDFWNLVGKTVPDWRAKRRRLKNIKF